MLNVTLEQKKKLATIAVLIIGLFVFLLVRGKSTSSMDVDINPSPEALVNQTYRLEEPEIESATEGNDEQSDTLTASKTLDQFQLDELDLPPLPTLYSMMSKLSESEQEKAYSFMEQEFGTWQSLRTVTADIEIKEGYIDPNKGFIHDEAMMVKLDFEVVPTKEKIGPTCAKIRVRLEIEEGIVILSENFYGDDPPVIWRKDGKEPSRNEILNIVKIYDSLEIDNTFTFPVVRCHDDFTEYQNRMNEYKQLFKAYPNAKEEIQSMVERTKMNDLIPIRVSSQKEKEDLFNGKDHYLFGIVDGSANYWFDTTNGELSLYSNPHQNAHRILDISSKIDPRESVQFGKYVYSEQGDAHFPTHIKYETIGLLALGKPARFRTEIDLSNVKINKKVSSSTFVAPSRAIKFSF